MGAPAPPRFDYGICAADYEGQPYIANGSPVCQDCIVKNLVPQFERALEFEDQYPPPWGSAILDVTALQDVLGEEFVEKYKFPVGKRRSCEFLACQRRLSGVGSADVRATGKNKLEKDGRECNAILLLGKPDLPTNGQNFFCFKCSKSSSNTPSPVVEITSSPSRRTHPVLPPAQWETRAMRSKASSAAENTKNAPAAASSVNSPRHVTT